MTFLPFPVILLVQKDKIFSRIIEEILIIVVRVVISQLGK